jgi:hypothetical protein
MADMKTALLRKNLRSAVALYGSAASEGDAIAAADLMARAAGQLLGELAARFQYSNEPYRVTFQYEGHPSQTVGRRDLLSSAHMAMEVGTRGAWVQISREDVYGDYQPVSREQLAGQGYGEQVEGYLYGIGERT